MEAMLKKYRVRLTRVMGKVERALPPRRLEKLCIVLAAVVFLVMLIASHLARPYTSDDVSTQLVRQTYHIGQKEDAVLGTDNFLIKVPLYWLSDVITPHNSRAKLFATVLVCNAAFFAGVIIFLRGLMKTKWEKSRLKILATYLPLSWFLGLWILPLNPAPIRITNYMNPNVRNAEMGIALLLLAACVRFLDGGVDLRRSGNKLKLGAFILFSSVFLYSDPYFTYTLVLPVLAVLAYFWFQKKYPASKLMSIGFLSVVAVIGAAIMQKIGDKIHFLSLANIPKQFIALDRLHTVLEVTLSAVFKGFNADFWGLLLNKDTAVLIFNALLAMLGCIAFVFALKNLKKGDAKNTLLIAIIAVVLAIFTFTSTNSFLNDRYILFAVILMVLLIPQWLVSVFNNANRRISLSLVAVLVVGILINFAGNAKLIASSSGYTPFEKPNDINYAMIHALEHEGVTKGYGQYWDSNINTYLADNKIKFLPVLCSYGHLKKFHWLINNESFAAEPRDGKTFLVYSNINKNISDCTEKDVLKKAFGTPLKSIKVGDEFSINIYSKDIGKSLGSFTPTRSD